MMNLNNYCKKYIIELLPNFTNKEMTMYELPTHVCNEFKAIQNISDKEANKMILEWQEEIKAFMIHEKEIKRKVTFNIDNPKDYLVTMILEGINTLLKDNEFIDDYWFDNVKLTDNEIEIILNQLKYQEINF